MDTCPFIPKIGLDLEFELSPYSSTWPRWIISPTLTGGKTWADEGPSNRRGMCKISGVFGDSFEITFQNGISMTIPMVPSAEGYRRDQWNLPGFFSEPGRANKNEEKCSCGRMKDVGEKCWLCGAGDPNVTKLGLDLRRTSYHVEYPDQD